MREIRTLNVNGAFTAGWWHLKTAGVREESRNGPVLVAPDPVCTTYIRPQERVLFNPVRDANPVFHMLEGLWMLAGYDDSRWLSQFNANIASYAEADGHIHGAYGHRWRAHFGRDQLTELVGKFKADPDTRHGVLQMWDPSCDLQGSWKDRPCNSNIYLDCRPDTTGTRRLNMTVCCRSNDMLWGAYGANVVHMSMMQEALAHAIGVPIGVYRQMSNNFHVYLDNPTVQRFLDSPPSFDYDFYSTRTTAPHPILQGGERFADLLTDCEDLCAGVQFTARTLFVGRVAKPLAEAYLRRRAGERFSIDNVPECDWKLAFSQWLERRA